MAQPVEERPSLPQPASRDVDGLANAAGVTVAELVRLFSQYGFRLNRVLPMDGSENMTGALTVKDTTDSSSSSTGSIQTDGGLGVVKKAHFGNRVTIENNVPQLRFIDTNQPLDEGDWEFVLLADGSFNLRTLTEAGGAGDTAFSVRTRIGTAIDTVDFGANNIITTGNIGIDTNVSDKSLEIRNANPIIRLRDTGTPAGGTNAFLEFGGTVAGVWSRTGWVGDGSSGDANISLRAEAGDLKLGDSSGGSVLILSGGDAIFSGSVKVSGAAPSPPAANTLYKGNIPKAWINFNGTGTIAIRDSFNVSGITDNGTGDYTVTWDLDFADDTYAATLGAIQLALGTNMASDGFHPTSSTYTAGALRVVTESASSVGNSTRQDRIIVCVHAFGAQA